MRTKVAKIARTFLIYSTIVEHPKNNYAEMDTRIYEEIIRPEVINFLKDKIEPQFNTVEEALTKFSGIIEDLRRS